MKKRYLRLAALTAGVLLAAQTGLSAAALSTFDAAYSGKTGLCGQ